MIALRHELKHFSDDLSAGFPSAAEGYEDEPLNLHDWIMRRPASTFFYRVAGDELRHEHICDGSILVVDRSVLPTRGRLILIERRGAFAIIHHVPGSPVICCGVVLAVVTRFG